MVVQMRNLPGWIEPGNSYLPGGIVEIVEHLPELAPDMGIIREEMDIVYQQRRLIPETFGKF